MYNAYLDGDKYSDRELAQSSRVVWGVFIMLCCFTGWASISKIDEVSVGMGKVIPSSKEQDIQSLEGGIVAELLVREGDIVSAGQPLAKLDPTRMESDFGESAAKFRAALARSVRLQAEVSNHKLIFPESLSEYSELIDEERRLYNTRRSSLYESVEGIKSALDSVSKELKITEELMRIGASSNVEVLRLKRERSELKIRLSEVRSKYMVEAREELAKVNAEVEMLKSTLVGHDDSLTRLTLRAPLRGIIKDIDINTVGGVIPPNGRIMKIVPLDERLLIEAKISPRDIAFIHTGQPAKIEITAYDYSVYGRLNGHVEVISPDTLQDEVKKDVFYYRVYIRTDSDFLENRVGDKFYISPGMIAQVNIKTGRKTVLDYLLKPLNKAREALRER